MLMQTPGSFLFCYTIAMSPGTNFTSWITYFVGGCLQGTLLILCIYYQFNPPIEFIHINGEQDHQGCEGPDTSDADEASEQASLTAEGALLASTDRKADSGAGSRP